MSEGRWIQSVVKAASRTAVVGKVPILLELMCVVNSLKSPSDAADISAVEPAGETAALPDQYSTSGHRRDPKRRQSCSAR